MNSSNVKLDGILKWAPWGIVFTDAKGVIILANKKAEELLETASGSLTGREAASALSCFDSTKTVPGSFSRARIYDKDIVFCRAPLSIGDEFTGEIWLFDEKENFQMDSELSLCFDLDKTLDSVVESFYDGIIFVENDYIVKVNNSFSRITGLKSKSIMGQKVEHLDGKIHICLQTIQEVVRLVGQFRKSVTSMGKLMQGNEIYVTGTPIWHNGVIRHIIVTIRDITELQLLKEEVSRLMALCLSTPEEARIFQLTGGEIIAENRVMRGILDMIARVAQVDTVVLFEGESGTGKEVLARLIHRRSTRRKGPFITVNCGAIPENLFESELFGYAKGAFTGAVREGKPGLFELADGGIIFLDEVAALPLNCQVKLLKVIEDFEIMRVGGRKPIKLNVRIIAATNRNLEKMVRDGRFREDLFYRLYVVPIKIPPLRERKEDIFPLAWHFLRRYNKKFNQSKTFSPEIIQIMESYQWPGNIRELQHVIERMVIMSDKELLQPHHLPSNVYDQQSDDGSMIQVKGLISLEQAREMLEKKLLHHALTVKGTTREAARLLGVDHSTVVRKVKKYGLHHKNGLHQDQLVRIHP